MFKNNYTFKSKFIKRLNKIVVKINLGILFGLIPYLIISGLYSIITGNLEDFYAHLLAFLGIVLVIGSFMGILILVDIIIRFSYAVYACAIKPFKKELINALEIGLSILGQGIVFGVITYYIILGLYSIFPGNREEFYFELYKLFLGMAIVICFFMGVWAFVEIIFCLLCEFYLYLIKFFKKKTILKNKRKQNEIQRKLLKKDLIGALKAAKQGAVNGMVLILILSVLSILFPDTLFNLYFLKFVRLLEENQTLCLVILGGQLILLIMHFLYLVYLRYKAGKKK